MSKKDIVLLGVLNLISLAGYILVSRLIYGMGFPLDDAWIHQTYARNLANEGAWQFGATSTAGGSTGPLWGVMIAVWYVLGLSPFWGTMFWGALMLYGNAWTAVRLSKVLTPAQNSRGIWLAALMLFEFHLVWAAGSGMETLLFSFLVLSVFYHLYRDRDRDWLMIGVLTGVSVWVRPGGLTLLGPAAWGLFLSNRNGREKVTLAVNLILSFAGIFILYLGFNQLLNGDWWPNTFYAKQAEYAQLRQLPLWRRLGRMVLPPLVGAGSILVPGFLIYFYNRIKQAEWAKLAGPLWGAGYILLYALRLPVTYQHGRYVIPVVPVLLVYGWVGMRNWLELAVKEKRGFVLSRAWVVSLAVVALVFWGLGARAYGRDVAVIETEMVRTARWVDENIQTDQVLAAHDIGALGYFTDHRLVDLAGLVSPDVIPFIRDQGQLAHFLDEEGAAFLITFPDWYPDLVQKGDLIYQTKGQFAPEMGGENMAVYRWQQE